MSMTLEEAIANREDFLKYLEENETITTPELVEAVRWSVKALKDIRPVSREQVEKVWSPCNFCAGAKYITGAVTSVYPVGETHQQETRAEGDFDFCPVCGRPMTDEAVDILLKRLEAMKDE